jgi:hypothetical protein
MALEDDGNPNNALRNWAVDYIYIYMYELLYFGYKEYVIYL